MRICPRQRRSDARFVSLVRRQAGPVHARYNSPSQKVKREVPMFTRAVLTWAATLLVLALTGSTALSAPVAQTQTFAQTTIPPTPTPVSVDTFDPAAAGGRTVVKWYVGLGTGTDPKQIDVQRNVVDQFNKSQQDIYLTLQIVG